MKRLTCLLLIGILLLTTAGCTKGTKDSEVSFYYPRTEFDHGNPDGVIVPEIRDVTGHSNELRYLLALYLQGPSDPELCFSFPEGTILVEFAQENQVIDITLSSKAAMMDDIDVMIACACLAETCFAISDAQQVHIQSLVSAAGLSVDTIINRGSILLPGYEILSETTE